MVDPVPNTLLVLGYQNFMADFFGQFLGAWLVTTIKKIYSYQKDKSLS